MLKRYEDALTARLEAVEDVGSAYLWWGEMYRWYGVKRIDRHHWKDLKERYQTVVEDDTAKLWIKENGDGVMLISDDGHHEIDVKFAKSN